MHGIKMLISSVALAATLAGWLRLATGQHESAWSAVGQPAPWVAAVPAPESRTVSYRVAALPTLVPLIAQPKASARRAVSGLAAAQPAPQSALPALTTLREVSAPPAPPAPVAVSRSSR